MWNRWTRPGLVRAAAAAAAFGASVMLMRHYGPADASPVAPPAGAACDAPAAASPAAAHGIRAQIRYDSGLVLRYCSLAPMFAQLDSLEQPGLVRAVYVLGATGQWQKTSPASRPGGAY